MTFCSLRTASVRRTFISQPSDKPDLRAVDQGNPSPWHSLHIFDYAVRIRIHLHLRKDAVTSADSRENRRPGENG
jgi:hypothetical protein